MGTNYYLHTSPLYLRYPELAVAADEIELKHGAEAAHPIREVGRQMLHIGKSSRGWTFGLHVFTARQRESDPALPENLEGWKALFESPHCRIEDEYGATLSVEEMLAVICERGQHDDEHEHDEHFLHVNNAIPGPHGLVRRQGSRHEGGTWDLVFGEFS